MAPRPFSAIVAELADAGWALHAVSACFALDVPARLPATTAELVRATGAPALVIARLLDVMAALELVDDTAGVWTAAPPLAELPDLAFWRSELLRHTAKADALDAEALAMTDRLFVGGAFPELPELEARLGDPGAAILDVGTGAAGNAVAFARAYPAARVVGVDVSPVSLELAGTRVRAEGLVDRITLRRQSITELPDVAAYDVVWLPQMFFDDDVLAGALRRCVPALRPGGWLVTAWISSDGFGLASAVANLLDALFGGRARTAELLDAVLERHGLHDRRRFRHGDALGVIAGRR